jgi:CrcB protein
MAMTNLLLVGLGGFVGSIARYLLGEWILHQTAEARFPWGTFTVNLLGCLAIGVLSGVAERLEMISPTARLFLFTGVLGGFTTFSAFGLETVYLLRRNELWIAAAYTAGSVVVGLLFLWLGLRAVHLLAR